MAWPDIVNGSFETFGAASTWLNCLRLYRDKMVRGVVWQVAVFWVSWGAWNCFYYPYLHQTVSFIGGVAVMLGNATWVGMVIYYRRKRGHR